jgi:hypothetical protein
VACPSCARPIIIREADLRLAAAGVRVVPAQPEDDQPLDAVPLDVVELRVAREGSRPGLAEGITHMHDEARLASAFSGRPVITTGESSAASAIALDHSAAGAPRPARRGFLADMLSSFYFAGIRNNALNVLAAAVPGALLAMVLSLPLPIGPLRALAIIPLALIGIYLIQFYWSVLKETANGEDEIPWVAADWDLWEDAGKPVLWIAGITILCLLPSLISLSIVPPGVPWRQTAACAALVMGMLLWPVGVMSVAIGNTILFARPDWLVRCMIGIGPLYLLAWALVMLVLGSWWVFLTVARELPLAAILGVFVNFYLGYVLFRMLGLIYYHFRTRFPWRFED